MNELATHIDDDDDELDDNEPVRPVDSPRTAILAGERAQAAAAGDAVRPERNSDSPVTVQELFEAGVHFGHQTRRWNPKMRTYIYGARNGIHIIDLDQTARLFAKAFEFLSQTVARGGNILFVGTKRQAQEIIREEALRANMFYVTNRWLGGTLTNFRTIKGALDRLKSLERMKDDGTYNQLPKKETVRLEKERTRLEKHIGGLKGMTSVPQAICIIDPSRETIAVKEARKLNLPLVAITDTNCDPEVIDYVIPGNDDAIRSIRLVTSVMADACMHGAANKRERNAGKDKSETNGAQRSDTTVVYQQNRARW